jgi:predicted  nucleic acid-binding Zn-ribbon protein
MNEEVIMSSNTNQIPDFNPDSFNEAFTTLKAVSDKLSHNNNNSSADIDSLVEDVKKASEAYNACNDKLIKTEEEINKYLKKMSASEPEEVDEKPKLPTAPDFDDDIPF